MTRADGREATVRAYLQAMEASDLDATAACFAPDGAVLSPVYGAVPARSFYERLFADTLEAAVDVLSVYASLESPQLWAAHFAYRWRRRDGSEVATDVVDLFEFEADGERIERLKIVFNPSAGK